MVKVRFRGQIISGSDEYSLIGIQENFDAKGDLVGLNILMAASTTFEGSYDDWVENYPALIEYLQDKDWVIKWLSAEG